MSAAILLLSFIFAAPPEFGGLEVIRKDPSWERRSERALELAESRLHTAREIATNGGGRDELKTALDGLAEAVEYSIQNLRETGKKPAQMTRQYKKGELKTRDFLKRLGDLAKALPVEERPAVEVSRVRVQKIQEEYLLGVMSKK